MATELIPPFITLDNAAGVRYLAAHDSWGQAVHATFLHRIDDGGVERDTTPADFAIFDGRGFLVTVNANDNAMTHVVQSIDRSGEVRARAEEVLTTVAPADAYLNPTPEPLALVQDTSLSFVHFGFALAAALRVTPSALDPHRRNWWHNLCHRFYR